MFGCWYHVGNVGNRFFVACVCMCVHRYTCTRTADWIFLQTGNICWRVRCCMCRRRWVSVWRPLKTASTRPRPSRPSRTRRGWTAWMIWPCLPYQAVVVVVVGAVVVVVVVRWVSSGQIDTHLNTSWRRQGEYHNIDSYARILSISACIHSYHIVNHGTLKCWAACSCRHRSTPLPALVP